MNVMFYGALCALVCVSAVRASDNSSQLTITEEPLPSCQIPEGVEPSCDLCVVKGSHCFWCEKTKTCADYVWHFPNCPIDSVKYHNCWVNWAALTITLGVLGGLVVALLCCCMCCCCYRCKKCRAKWVQRSFERRHAKEMAARLALENKQEQRRMQHRAQLDEIRQKYGIAPPEPKYERM